MDDLLEFSSTEQQRQLEGSYRRGDADSLSILEKEDMALGIWTMPGMPNGSLCQIMECLTPTTPHPHPSLPLLPVRFLLNAKVALTVGVSGCCSRASEEDQTRSQVLHNMQARGGDHDTCTSHGFSRYDLSLSFLVTFCFFIHIPFPCTIAPLSACLPLSLCVPF